MVMVAQFFDSQCSEQTKNSHTFELTLMLTWSDMPTARD